MPDGAARRSRDRGRACFCASKKKRRPQVFYDEIHKKLDRKLRNFFSLNRCVQMRDSKKRARQRIAGVTKTKKARTGSTRQKIVVQEPPSQDLYILPLWEKPSDMERVAVGCLIKAKSVRKGATEFGVHRQSLTDAMGRMRCAALRVTQCQRQPRIRQDATRRRRQAVARCAFYFLLFAAVATGRVR